MGKKPITHREATSNPLAIQSPLLLFKTPTQRQERPYILHGSVLEPPVYVRPPSYGYRRQALLRLQAINHLMDVEEV